MIEKVNVGIIGLGRMGSYHAYNVITRMPQAKLTDVCVLGTKSDLETIAKLEKILNYKLNVYYEFEEMITKSNINAVLIISSTKMHPKHIEMAMKNGIHTFTEKPLGITIQDAQKIQKIVHQYQNVLFAVGFMRRYDDSYAYAKKMIDEEKIGQPFMVRSIGQDPINKINGALAFGPTSGGEFIDMAPHDINLITWYLGVRPREIWAIGDCYKFLEFKKWNDGDNVSCMMKMEKNKFGTEAMATIMIGRTAPHGYNVETEIYGTKGIIKIGIQPRKNLVDIYDETGIVIKCSESFEERFGEAYFKEINQFLTNVKLKINNQNTFQSSLTTVDEAVENMIIAFKCKESFETKQMIAIDWTQYDN